MRWITHNTMARLLPSLVVAAVMAGLMTERGWAFSAQAAATTQTLAPQPAVVPASPVAAAPTQTSNPTSSVGQGVMLDRVTAVVNGDVILESDVDEERRFEEIQPYRRSEAELAREAMLERLIDRELILQQAVSEPEDVVTDQELDAQLASLRSDIPDCKQYHCETDDGWQKYLAVHGFTVEEFRARWLLRMKLLKFIEVRFRSGIKITNAEIKQFYDSKMLPEYEERKVTPPNIDTISKRIEEVLLQQQVGALLVDWLKSLRAQGSVTIMTPGEVAP
jgi:peptidyl-prolyl cis-trans isomerase SurA